MRAIILLLFSLAAVSPVEGHAQDLAYDQQLEARVWLDRGEEPVLDRGDRVRVYYRTSEPAYAAIFRIDTDGVVSLLFPQRPEADSFVLGGRDFRLLFPRSPEWRVEEAPGAGYFFIVASQEPLDFSAFGYDRVSGWDLSSVGEVIYEDPYVAMDEFVAQLIPDWEVAPYALDFMTYSVGETHTYPRFLCYDCHGFQSYSSWNPYAYQCSTYQVVIWDDPYFYPGYRYSGTRVVYATPIRNRPRYGVTTRVAGTGWAPLVRVREAPVTSAQFKEPAVARGAASSGAQRRAAATVPSGQTAPRVGSPSGNARTAAPRAAGDRGQVRPPSSTTRQAAPTRQATPTRGAAPARGSEPGASSTRPTLRRRPSSAVRDRQGTGASTGQRPASGARPAPSTGARTRAVVPTRPSSQPRAGTARPSTRPSSQPRAGTARPSTRPSSQPRAGTARPTARPSARPSAGSARPSARPSSRPTAGSARPSTRPSTQRPAAGARPSTTRPSGQRPSARPSTTPSRPPTRTTRPSTGSRPSASGGRPSARPPPARPTVKPRPRRPGGG